VTLDALLADRDVPRCFVYQDRGTGLRAVLVLDDLSLGPAAGGIRTRAYPSLEAAIAECADLARSMTQKCALAGLAAGGGKGVVVTHPGLDRPAAFALLGRRIEELGGLFRTAGDLGTTDEDLAAMARETRYVHPETPVLTAAVARGVVRCVEAAVRVRAGMGVDAATDLRGLRVAVQGCGAIGAAVARGLADAGATVRVSDVDEARARRLEDELGASVVGPDALLSEDVDVLCPCAVGGVLDRRSAGDVRAWAVVPAANRVFVDDAGEAALASRGILVVPDPISSAGAVVAGIGRSVMGLADPLPLIDALGGTAQDVLLEARRTGALPSAVARARADARVAAADGARPGGAAGDRTPIC